MSWFKKGQLLWVCNHLRPDIYFDATNIASNIKNATIKQLIDINKTIKKTKTNPSDLKFQPTEKQSKLIVYINAAFGNLHDEESQSACLIFFVNPNAKFKEWYAVLWLLKH